MRRQLEITSAQLVEFARDLARESGNDPDVMIARGPLAAFGSAILPGYYLVPQHAHPSWYLYKPVAELALAKAAGFLGVELVIVNGREARAL